MLNEIGSNFWINPNQKLSDKELQSPKQFGCDGDDYVWLSTGRSATRFVIKSIEERNTSMAKRVLLPPFTCNTVIEPFYEAGYEIHYYDVDRNLNSSIDELLGTAIAKKIGIVLFHRYYGFDTFIGDINKLEDLRKHGIVIVEDCTQCLYSNFNKQVADYTIGSIRKWLGTPDGGFAVCATGTFLEKPTQYDEKLEKAKVVASYNKYKYLFNGEGEKSQFLQQYRDAEVILDQQKECYAIGKMSAKLQSNLNFSELTNKRRKNFETLLINFPKGNKIEPFFKNLHEEAVPLYFPILVKNRSSLQQLFVKNEIYAPVVWQKPECQDVVCEWAEYLYEHLLCIPVDQRYDKVDMMRVISVMKEYNKQ